uniref:Prenylcysteine lyase domain-containing protein n=1 Tax=Kwoniella bestiolae CBS 10118 TaxID=1296100 RepID=A0A1B9G956_9TREE|nr:hypothetical protein I302_02404 [Kwoniella bestiolae CBS 10118]OCF27562.1 hypothetical protein I302_02404 [Kwoniella bestiolae CBS 10118]
MFISLFGVLSILLIHPFHSFTSAVPFTSRQEDVNSTLQDANSTSTSSVAGGFGGTNGAKRVAIIGAGASGSAAAFFLNRAARAVEKKLGVKEGSKLGEIVVFEKEGYVGGRSTVIYPHDDHSLRAQELGGSIFVGSNINMMKGAEHFNLTLITPDSIEPGIAIWDGQKFLVRNESSSWLTSPEGIARYGLDSIVNADAAVTEIVQNFLKLYDPAFLSSRGPTESIEEHAESAGLGVAYTAKTGENWALDDLGVSEAWMGEFWEAATRANYATDMPQIHALGAGVSLAASGASSIQGGNWQIFKGMLDESKATVKLNTQASFLLISLPFLVQTKKAFNDIKPFDAVLFAAPWHSSPISKKLEAKFESPIPAQQYVRLHVTYLTTTKSRPQASLFGLNETDYVPRSIMTSALTSRKNGTTPSNFESIAWHAETPAGEYPVKVFSLARLTDQFINDLIGETPSWLVRKEWDAYPLLSPIGSYAPVEPIKGLHYLAAQEAWVSTMDTQTVSGREAVARLVNEWWGLGQGDCASGDDWDWTCSA